MTDSEGRKPSTLSQAERQRTIDLLCEHFANDALTMDQFEARVDAAHRANSSQELEQLLSGLPIEKSEAPVEEKTQVAPVVPPGRVRERAYTVAVFGGTTRKGRWIPPRKTFSVAIMGGVQLDFRDAMFGPGVTEVDILALFGGVEIIVPPGLHVESEGIAIMGGFEHREDSPGVIDPSKATLRIKGLALFGGVEVWVGQPGESQREAKRRLKKEKRARKLKDGRV